MTKEHMELLREFKRINTAVEVVEAIELVGEKYATYDGRAIKVTLSDGNWLRVYRIKNGELNWY